jgi:hypothetical protein
MDRSLSHGERVGVRGYELSEWREPCLTDGAYPLTRRFAPPSPLAEGYQRLQ